MHLQKGTTAEETLEGKKALELTYKQMGIQVRNFHADNGVFRDNQWMKENTFDKN